MGEAEKLAAMTTDARIVEAIKSTDYKYFGDYEMSDGQRDAVDVLVVAARELMKLRTDHLAALRRAKAEVLRELTQSLTYTRFNSYEQGMCERGYGLTKEGKIGASIGLAWARGEIDARAAQIEEGE